MVGRIVGSSGGLAARKVIIAVWRGLSGGFVFLPLCVFVPAVVVVTGVMVIPRPS